MSDMFREIALRALKKAMPKLARVVGGGGYEIGERLTLTYMSEVSGMKAFMIGTLLDHDTTTPLRMVRVEIDNTYRPQDTVVATVLGQVNGEDMWAINPRSPKLLNANHLLLLNNTSYGHLIYLIDDPDNPDADNTRARVLDVSSCNEEVITAWADEVGTIRFRARGDGETYLHVYVTTGTGQDFAQIPVRVDSTLPQVTFVTESDSRCIPRHTIYTDMKATFSFKVVPHENRPDPEYTIIVLDLELPHKYANLNAEVDKAKQQVTITPTHPGKVLLQLHVTNAGKACYAEMYLDIVQLPGIGNNL